MAIKVTTSKGAYFFNHPVLQSLGSVTGRFPRTRQAGPHSFTSKQNACSLKTTQYVFVHTISQMKLVWLIAVPSVY